VHIKNYGPARIEFAHVVIDDHSRLAYVEIHRHDRGDIAAAVLRRATSSSRRAPRAGTAKQSDSSALSTRNARTRASGPHLPDATARWHPSCATTTAEGHTPRSATGHHQPHSPRPRAGHLGVARDAAGVVGEHVIGLGGSAFEIAPYSRLGRCRWWSSYWPAAW
jgi:hypothetical protein